MSVSGKEKTFYSYVLWILLSLILVVFLYKLIFPHGFSLHKGMVKVSLYFPTEDLTKYRKETRWIRYRNDPQDMARVILQELAKGPKSVALSPVIPQGTRVNGVYIASNGVAYVDFSEQFIKNHPGGSAAERATVESIFLTLKANIHRIKAVKFLVNGKEIKQLKGHLDMSLPFYLDFKKTFSSKN